MFKSLHRIADALESLVQLYRTDLYHVAVRQKDELMKSDLDVLTEFGPAPSTPRRTGPPRTYQVDETKQWLAQQPEAVQRAFAQQGALGPVDNR